MQEWFSHYLAGARAEIYEAYQFLRPDYRKAMSTLRKKAAEVLREKRGNLAVLDVACGDAVATRQVFSKTKLGSLSNIRFVGLDHDINLLNEARLRWPQLDIYHADMARARIEETFDIILCSFAYHHVADSEKVALCKNLLKWCNPDGDLFVLEICLSSNQIRPYYDELKRTLLASPIKEQCIRFLDWTMSSDYLSNGEWKVDMVRLERDFKQAGWGLCDAEAIWTAPSLPPKTGCYFLHFRPGKPHRL